MNESYVYMLVDPRNNQPFYVGKGKGSRCYFHSWEAKHSNKHTRKLNKIRKIQRLGFEIEIRKIEKNVSDEQAKDFECLLIAEMRDFKIDLTNVTDGGEGTSGHKQSQETIKKRMAHRVGKPLSEEHRAKIKLSWEGRKTNCIKIKAIASENKPTGFVKGYKQSEEHKQKISAALKNKPKPIVECPHCLKKLSPAMAKRWHFDNCKNKE